MIGWGQSVTPLDDQVHLGRLPISVVAEHRSAPGPLRLPDEFGGNESFDDRPVGTSRAFRPDERVEIGMAQVRGQTRVGEEHLGRPDLPLAEIGRPGWDPHREEDCFQYVEVALHAAARKLRVRGEVGDVENPAVPGGHEAK